MRHRIPPDPDISVEQRDCFGGIMGNSAPRLHPIRRYRLRCCGLALTDAGGARRFAAALWVRRYVLLSRAVEGTDAADGYLAEPGARRPRDSRRDAGGTFASLARRIMRGWGASRPIAHGALLACGLTGKRLSRESL